MHRFMQVVLVRCYIPQKYIQDGGIYENNLSVYSYYTYIPLSGLSLQECPSVLTKNMFSGENVGFTDRWGGEGDMGSFPGDRKSSDNGVKLKSGFFLFFFCFVFLVILFLFFNKPS